MEGDAPETATASPIGEPLRRILDDLHQAARDVEVSLIVSPDGLTIISLGPAGDGERAGALCADLLSLCHKTASELQRGDVEEVLLKGARGCMLLTPAGPRAVLAIMARPDANLGMIRAEARRAADAIPGAL